MSTIKMESFDGECEMAPLHDDESELVASKPQHRGTTRKRRRILCCQTCTEPNLSMKESETSYYRIIRDNRSFRLFFASYTASHLGEWLTYLASIAALEQQYQRSADHATDEGIDKTMISILVIVRLLPNVILAPFGGVLADGRDRRQSMIALDLAGALVGALFILSVWQRSVIMIYLASFVQQCLAGLYEPCRSAIVPLLVENESQLKVATTINALTWSLVAAIGSSMGGILVSSLGLEACFLIDSATYILSAFLMFLVPGSFKVLSDDEPGIQTKERAGSLCSQIQDMLVHGATYVWSSFFGAIVLFKASAAAVYGSSDVLNVAFSERGDPEGMSSRLGILFGFIGVGCLMGPLISDRFTDMENPKSLQLACVYSMCQVALGSVLMGLFYQYFWMTCLFTVVRAAGSSVLWINSSLLLQKFSSADLLGRVSSIDYSLALLSEAISAYVAGVLLDRSSLKAQGVCFILGAVGALIAVCWVFYHRAGLGAAGDVTSRQADDSTTDESLSSETDELMESDAGIQP